MNILENTDVYLDEKLKNPAFARVYEAERVNIADIMFFRESNFTQGQRLFVYGTLKRGMKNEMAKELAKYSVFIGNATWNGKLYMVDYYPGAVVSDNPNDTVYGELYELKKPDIILGILDEYEECSDNFPEPKLFKRIKSEAYLETGVCLETWIYVYNLPAGNLKRIVSGDFQ